MFSLNTTSEVLKMYSCAQGTYSVTAMTGRKNVPAVCQSAAKESTLSACVFVYGCEQLSCEAMNDKEPLAAVTELDSFYLY